MRSLVNIPIHHGQMKAVDEVGLKTHNAIMMDCYVDELLGVNRRPGLVSFVDLLTSAAVDGLFWWEAQDMVLAVSNGNLYKITDSNGTFSQITIADGESFEVGKRVTWADYGTAVYAANGGKIIKIGPTSAAVMADADAPTTVSHVAFLDTYLLGNEVGTRRCHRSNAGYPDTWEANYFSKEAQYDDLQAIEVANLELYMLGDRTLEVWQNDGSTPFVRSYQGFVQSGTVAKSSFIFCGDPINRFCWIDQKRNVVMLEGRNPIALSGTLTKYIQGFSAVHDAISDYMVLAGRPYLVIHFPTEDKTLVFDFQHEHWYEWGYWNAGAAEYNRWRGNCFVLAPAWNFPLVGDRANGKIYKASNTTYTDNSATMRSLIRTAHIDHGYPGHLKKCNGIFLRVKRTEVDPGASSLSMVYRYRDDGDTSWSNEVTLTLSAQSGYTDYQVDDYMLGSYYTRQWELVMTDDAALSIVQFQEDVTI